MPLLKALKDKEDAQTPLSLQDELFGKKLCKYFELVPQYFSMHCRNTGEEVNAAMSQLGASRFWTGIGDRVAHYHHMHEGRRSVRHLDDDLIRQAVCQVTGRTRGQSSRNYCFSLEVISTRMSCVSTCKGCKYVLPTYVLDTVRLRLAVVDRSRKVYHIE